MIIVIADDITGAAEMAGVAFDYGLRARLVLDLSNGLPDVEVVVVATDTRSMSEREAVATTKDVVAQCSAACPGMAVSSTLFGATPAPDVILFKKTDSALRGHVMAELAAILSSSPYKQAILLPANPSRGRIVKEGIYYCDGKPISQTDFAVDPEFPALVDRMADRFPEATREGVTMPDACDAEQVAEVVRQCPHDTLLAGAADLFEALLVSRGHTLKAQRVPMTFDGNDIIVVAGSTQSQPSQLGIPVKTMPREVYEGKTGASEWIEELIPAYRQCPRLVLAVPFRHLTGKAVAVRLRQTMAAVVRALVEVHCPQTLVIEGGATAYCCLGALSWRQFSLAGVYAPGVIQMVTPQTVSIILKPGSYPWPIGSE